MLFAMCYLHSICADRSYHELASVILEDVFGEADHLAQHVQRRSHLDERWQ